MVHPDMAPRRRRADAQRNVGALIEAARTVFATSGVDARRRRSPTSPASASARCPGLPAALDLVKAIVESGWTPSPTRAPLSAALSPPKHSPGGSTVHRLARDQTRTRPRRCARGPGLGGAPRLLPAATRPPSPRFDAAVDDGTVRTTSAPRICCAPSLSCRAVPGLGRNRPAHRRRLHRRPALQGRAPASRAPCTLTLVNVLGPGIVPTTSRRSASVGGMQARTVRPESTRSARSWLRGWGGHMPLVVLGHDLDLEPAVIRRLAPPPSWH